MLYDFVSMSLLRPIIGSAMSVSHRPVPVAFTGGCTVTPLSAKHVWLTINGKGRARADCQLVHRSRTDKKKK